MIHINEVQTQTLDVLTTEILILKRQTAANIIEIGKRLLEVRKQKQHGEWLPYLTEVVGFSQQQASRMMRIAREFGNYSALSSLEPTKVYALLDAPIDERDRLVQEAPGMTTREFEAAVQAAKREAEEAKRRAADAEAKARDLASRPPQVVERTVEVVKLDPELARKHEQTRKEYDQVVRRLEQVSRERDQLAKQAHKDQALEEAIKEKERRIAELAAMEEEMAARFADDHRDPKAGMVLTQLVHRLLEVASPAEVELTRLEAKGVGGWANDDKVREAIKVLRNVTATLQAIMDDRDSRPIEVSVKEVR